MADDADASSATAQPAAGGKTKAQKKKSSTEANPHLDPYKFTEEEDPKYQKNITNAIWQAGTSDVKEERILPRPSWATLVWGPVPHREDHGFVKKLIQPGSGGARKKQAGDRTDDEVRSELYQAWSKSTTKVMGSRNLVVIKTSDLGPSQVVAYLGFPDHGALAAFALTEGMFRIPIYGPRASPAGSLVHMDQATQMQKAS